MRDVTLDEAILVLREGGLVAMPTETVYGLAADATNEAAVRRVFAVKGRPADHPLILHLADARSLDSVALRIPPLARRLAALLWPGPLTLVLEKSDAVLSVVTGGRSTVAVRVPQHPLARQLILGLGRPVAAPSANRFGAVSPTEASHVRADLNGTDVALLDGGPLSVGLESTIVAFEDGGPVILRQGGIPREELEAIVGHAVPIGGGVARAPGMLASHYAPRAEVIPVAPAEIASVFSRLRDKRVVLLSPQPTAIEGLVWEPIPDGLEARARGLYASLRGVDARGFDVALVELPEERGLGAAIADRIRRASAPRA